MRKRMTSLLLTLVMLLSLVPAMGVTASAAEPEWTTVNTFDQLKEAMQQGTKTNIKLGKDINTNGEENHRYGLTPYDTIKVGNTITLDLNGKKLTLNSGNNRMSLYIRVVAGRLTVQDSVGGGEIFLNDEYKGGSSLMQVEPEATFTLKSGTLRATTPKPRSSGITLIENVGTVNIESGTLTCTQKDGSINANGQLDDWSSCYALLSRSNSDSVQTTISGGTFTGYVEVGVNNNGKQSTISGGTFNNDTIFKLNDEKNMTWTAPGLAISNGTFKGETSIKGLCYHEKSTDIAAIISGGTFDSLQVVMLRVWVIDYELFKQTYEDNGRDLSKVTLKQGYAPYQLLGGTYGDLHFGNAIYPEYDPILERTHKAFRQLLRNGGIKVGDTFYPFFDIEKAILEYRNSGDFDVENPNNETITVIPDVAKWGMKSVTLDGNPIDYFKDWKGTVEERDNSTAHTLKFEWYPLAQELKDAGYTYRANFDCYTVGSNTPTTSVPISATATEYSHTIPAGAAPSVYPFDLQLNLDKNGSSVGIMSNQHIVKLVVSEAPVAPPSLTGQVYYTSGIVYGSPISIAASVTPAEATKSYQWQRSTDGGSTWTNIDGATSGKYTPVAADMGENVRIRVKVTAEGYLGEIVGAALKVSKAANNNYPEVIKLEAVKNGAGNYTGFKITNFDSDCEYVYSTTDTANWSANQISSATVTGLTSNTTYYVFARFKETNTHTAGSIVSKNSIRLFDNVPLHYVLLEGYNSDETIYIKKGESVTLKVSADPSNANSWKEITFKESGTATGNITISNGNIAASTGTATPFPNGHTITITGVSNGNATLDASYSGPTQPYYGRWNVVVYDDSTVANALRLESVYAYEDITLSENDTAELPTTNLPKLLPENSGYHLEWRILKRATYGASYVTENDNIKLEDGKIKPKAAHAASEKAQLELVAVKDGSDTYRTLPKTSLFYVTVTEAPVIELTGVTVAPTKVNLDLNATYQLSAVKEPVNAAGTPEWKSSDTNVATVSSTGEVTAKGQGEATITVTCGGMKATCTVLVDHKHDFGDQTWQPMGPGLHSMECVAGDYYKTAPHNFSEWTDKNDGKTHSHTCDDCKYTETANHNWQWVVETAATPNADGQQHEECVDCHAVKTGSETVIPALTSIMVENLTVAKPVKGDAAAIATTGDSTYNVANTEWMAADGTPLAIGDKFQPGTVYTVKITLETAGAGVFSVNSTYNTIEGKTATVSPKLTGNDYADSVILTYTFDKTAGGYHPGTGTGTGTTTYPITVKSAKNGDVTASHKSAAKGTTVTLTVDPDKGYVLDTLTVLDGKDKEIKLTEKNGKYTFTMPASKVTVAATFKVSAPTGKNPFVDVPAGSYYEDAVVWAVEKGITSGTSAVTFDPNGSCTRAQAVTFLWRAAGSPAPKTKVMPFTDVPSGSYYYDAVLWAMEQGITKGTSDTAFSPNASCTRAQIVTFLWRANGSPVASGNSAFTDVAADAYYAAAVTWAEKNGVTGGIGNGLFGSGNNCTRAQIVTFLYRAMK